MNTKLTSKESISIVEEPSFFSNKDYRLFSILHHPLDAIPANRQIGIIFCDPFGEEKLWAHRVFVSFARFLARNAYWVLRFDCMGHGDSDGNDVDATLETQLSDIHQAIAFLINKTQVKKVILLGARFGGTLAAMAAAADPRIDGVVLWNPILKGEKYFQECLRSNLTTQMTTYRKIKYTREQMVKELLAGRPVNIDGYLISSDFYKQISQIDLVAGMRSYSRPLLMVQIHKEENVKIDKELQGFHQTLEEAGKPAQFMTVRGEPFWRELKTFPQQEALLFEKTADWIAEQTGPSVPGIDEGDRSLHRGAGAMVEKGGS
ncbi:MAG: alpha/beta fold hydrolase [Nitrospirae bacterium]|nr:alpha/beta fold hydrolase [Nitrospirota bacterium]